MPIRRLLAASVAAIVTLTGLAAVPLLTAAPANADPVTVVSADTFIRQSAPDENNGNLLTLSVQRGTVTGTGARPILLKVNVPAVPAGETLDGFTVDLYVQSSDPGATLTVDEVDSSWTEAGVTWNTQPSVVTSDIGSAVMGSSNAWLSIPVTGLIPSSTVSLEIRSDQNVLATASSKENSDGNAPTLTMLAHETPPVQNPTATRGDTSCGAVDVDYATGSGDTASSEFVTTVDGSQVDDEVVSAPSGSGGYTGTLAEDSSGGSADVEVTANGSTVLSFAVDTDCASSADFRFGLNTASADWSTYYNDLNSSGGITVRRIFATSTSEQLSQVNAAVNAGLTPWVSIKLTSAAISNPSSADILVSDYADDYSAALPTGGIMFATVWHEPNNGDMTASQFGALQDELAPILAAHSNIKVGAILTSFQMVNNTSTDDGPNFNDFVTQEKPLLSDGTFSFFGIDAYETSSFATEPYDNLAAVETALDNDGVSSSVPIYIGEFNTYPNEGTEMGDTVDAFLADARLKVACLFLNASTWLPFESARKTPFKAALLDTRVIH